MAPPKLAGNAPVAYVLHPVIIGLVESLGHEFHFAALNNVYRGLCKGLHAHEPLLAHQRLNRAVAAVAGAHVVAVRLYFYQIARGINIRHQLFAAFHGGQPFVCAAKFVDMPVVREHAHNGQVAPYADLKVVGIVRGGDLHGAGAEFLFNVFVCYDGYFAPHNGDNYGFTNYAGIAFVVRMHGYRRIAKNGFGAGGSHGYGIALVRRIVTHVPKMALLFFVFNLSIAQRGLAMRAPVYYPVPAVNKALVVKVNEHLGNGLGAAFVHCEAFAVPVAAGAKLPELLYYPSAVFLFPVPRALQKRLASYVALVKAFLGHLFDYLYLGGYGRMVGAGQPQRFKPGHALVTDKRILQRFVYCVAYVQLTGYVRWGYDYAIRLLVGIRLGMKIAVLFPFFIQPVFHSLMVVRLWHLLHGTLSS